MRFDGFSAKVRSGPFVLIKTGDLAVPDNDSGAAERVRWKRLEWIHVIGIHVQYGDHHKRSVYFPRLPCPLVRW